MAKRSRSELESKLQADILEWLNSNGGHWINLVISALRKAGEPDIIGVRRGKFYAFEIKLPGENPTRLQEQKLKKIEKNGGITMVVNSIQQIKDLFNKEDKGV